MKRLLIIVLVLFPLAQLLAEEKLNPNKDDNKNVNTEQTAAKDTVNISKMVQEQIETARKKEVQIRKLKSEAALLPIVKVSNKTIFGFNPMPFLSGIYFSKGFILIYASILVALFNVIRRIKNKKNDSTRDLKKAINILRNEVVVKKQNRKLEKLRKKIHASNQLSNFGEQEIIKTAKKLQISKGELLLAVKINSHQVSNNYSRKFIQNKS